MKVKQLKGAQILILGLGLLVAAGGIFLAVFFGNETESSKKTEEKTAAAAIEIPVPDEANATKITLAQNRSQISGKGALVEKNKIKISQSGTYVLSGKLSDGKIEVEADENATVILLLSGVEITNPTGKAIESLKAAHTSIQVKEGTKNVVQSGEKGSTAKEETAGPENSVSGAAIYAVEEMSVAGEGELTVNGYRNDGIKGKQSLRIAGSSLTIESTHDAVQAEENLLLSGGKISVKSGEGSDAAEMLTNEKGGRPDSDFDTDWDMENQGKESVKGFKSGNTMVISSGEYNVDSYDDAFHSNGTIAVSGGELTIKSGDDGIHADQSLDISGGKITIANSCEGLEANQITIRDGEVNVTSADDGMNACGGNSNMGRGFDRTGQKPGEDAADKKETADMPNLMISGGTVTVDAGGDGLDSNGNLTIEGGTILVNGPTNSGNGALDSGSESGGKCTISGGTILALGSSGMAETFEETSSQSSFLHNLSSSYQEGDKIVISDSAGNELCSHTAIKTGNSIVFSSPDLKKGETYTVLAGEQKETITMESNSQSNGKGSGMGRGFGDRPQGGKGGMEKRERPNP